MRIMKAITVVAAAVLWLSAPGKADESSKLTYLTFSKSYSCPE